MEVRAVMVVRRQVEIFCALVMALIIQFAIKTHQLPVRRLLDQQVRAVAVAAVAMGFAEPTPERAAGRGAQEAGLEIPAMQETPEAQQTLQHLTV